jgi:hypothetical protein
VEPKGERLYQPTTVEKAGDKGVMVVLAPGELTKIRNASKREQEDMFADTIKAVGSKRVQTVAEQDILDFFGSASDEHGNKVNLQDMVNKGLVTRAEVDRWRRLASYVNPSLLKGLAQANTGERGPQVR